MKINLNKDNKRIAFDVLDLKEVKKHLTHLHTWKRARARKDLPVDVLDCAITLAMAWKANLEQKDEDLLDRFARGENTTREEWVLQMGKRIVDHYDDLHTGP